MKKFFSVKNLMIIELVVLIPSVLAVGSVILQRQFLKTVTANPISNTNYSSTPASISDFTKSLECITSNGTSKKCLDDFVTNYVGTKTTKEILADLEAARVANTEVENNCHPIAHAIGRYTYGKYGNIGDAFMACDQSCHSGCYHGVMERLFYTEEQLASVYTPHLTLTDMQKKVPGICDASNFKDPNQAVIFQCLHGVGHAILFSLDYKLEDALKSCDLLKTSYDQESCYGGVVMENITAFEKDKRDMKRDDPLYPCDKLEDKYKATCYLMQTSIMGEYGMAYEDMPAECLKAGIYAPQCFISIGRDMSNFARTGRADYVVKICEDYSGDHVLDCMNGAVYALADNTWDPSFAFPFCSQFKQQANQQQCFLSAANYISGIYNFSHTKLVDSCRQYAGSATDVCLSAVGN